MEHVNAKYLIALANGKTVKFKHKGSPDQPYSWFDITGVDSGYVNTSAADQLLSGNIGEFPVDFKIEDEK